MVKTAALIILLLGDLNFTGLQYMTAFSKAAYDPAFSFKSAIPVISKADVAIANLEGPLTFADWTPDSEKKQWRFRQLPVFAEGIKNAGINVLLLGNNHIADAGEAGIKDTVQLLKDRQISHVPPPRDGPLVIKKNGANLELWNVDVFSPVGSHPWAMSRQDFSNLIEKKYANRKDKFIAIVFVHDHFHGQTTDSDKEKFVARLRGAGINWVIFGGDHNPSVIKPDAHGGVHYGLGDFIFGCECSGATQGKALVLEAGAEGMKAQEIILQLGLPNNGYRTTFGGSVDFIIR